MAEIVSDDISASAVLKGWHVRKHCICWYNAETKHKLS